MVSLIIVDYNSIEKTIKYIDHCLEQFEKIKVNIIIVDNSLNNKSIEYMEKIDCIYCKTIEYNKKQIFVYKYRYHNLIIIKANENLGYAKGNNLGAQVSKLIYNDDYYIFSNNDLRFENKVNIYKFIDIITKDNSIAIIGPKIIGIDGKEQSPRKYNNIWNQLILYYPNILLYNLFGNYITNIDYTNNSKFTYWVMGCFMFVDAKKFEEIDMFDSKTFLYAEEMILSERLFKKGYRNYFFNDIEVIHEHGQTTKNTFDILKIMKISFESNYYYFKNYIKCNKFELMLAKISFEIYIYIFSLKSKIKEYFVRRKK